LILIKTKLSEKIEQIDDIKNKIDIDSAELTFMTMYQKCVDKKKGISQKILADLCMVFNKECNRVLHQIADFELEISIGANQNLRIYTLDSGVKIPAAMASGYQKFVIDMIMRIVLTTILSGGKSNNISNPNMLILDEGFGCLDKKNFIAVAEVLKKLKNNFKCMVIITHIEELKSYADEIINIERIKRCSKITYGQIFGGESVANIMLEMKLIKENKEFSDILMASRVEKNKKQALKQGEIKAKKELVVKIRTEKIKARDAEKVNRANIKAEKEKNDIELVRIMGLPDLIREHTITTFENADAVPMFMCKACNKSFVATERRILAHVSSKSYRAKHKKYIKSVL
jgi:ATPase subunit of ABC transporter with duplicated ATPase domains